VDEKENEINAETGFDFRRTGHFQFVLVSVLVSWSGMQLFGTRGEPLEKREKANKINGFMRVASDVEKRREMGQIGIFSPLLYQVGYPPKTGRILRSPKECLQASSRKLGRSVSIPGFCEG
jgi:hypothetical protein